MFWNKICCVFDKQKLLIMTANIYEQNIFDKFNKPQAELEKPKRGRKTKTE